MNIENKINRIAKALKIGHKPKLYGTAIVWSDKLEAIWLEKAREAREDLPRPILGGLSNEM